MYVQEFCGSWMDHLYGSTTWVTNEFSHMGDTFKDR
ncbi:hypothetical protein [Pseudomonas tohonis]